MTPNIRLLIIEDNPAIVDNMTDFLESKGYILDFAMDGIGGLHLALTHDYDVIVLDIMLPGMDGITLCQKLRREAARQVPVIMLTARDTLDDKLLGFESGADDYLVKPFALKELEARIKALAKRRVADNKVLSVGNLYMDLGTFEVTRQGKKIDLNNTCISIFKTAHGIRPQCGVPQRPGEPPLGGHAAGQRCAAQPYVHPAEKNRQTLCACHDRNRPRYRFPAQGRRLMKFYQSIRFRIVACILLFGTLLIILNTGITFFVMGDSMSKMIANLIDTEVDTFLYKYEKDRTTPLPHSKYIDVFAGVEAVPDRHREQVKNLSPGIHAIEQQDNRPPKYVGVMQLAGKDVPYFMFFHGREFFEENAWLHPKQILMISLALLLIPGILIGYITSRMLFAPVVTLMGQIKALNPEKIPVRFFQKHADNELGMLTRTIETAMNRINAFIRREKQFTRDASHELRTPLTIVKGAVEIMEQQPELETNPLLKKPLKRISRSVKDMETTIETFLWLAREEGGTEEPCRVEPVVRKAIEDSRYLMENKDIRLHM